MKLLAIFLLVGSAWAQGIQYNGVSLGANTNSQAAPTVDAISPAVDGAGGGKTVTITGANFISGATATVAGVSCGSLSVVNSTTITCTTGAMTATGAQTASVAVTTAGGTGTLNNAFDVEPALTTTYVNQLFEPAQIALSGNESTATTGGIQLTSSGDVTNCVLPAIQSSVFKTGTNALQTGGNTGNGNTLCGQSWFLWGMANPQGFAMGNVQPPNPAAANTNGVYFHFFLAVNQSWIDNAKDTTPGPTGFLSNMKLGGQRGDPTPTAINTTIAAAISPGSQTVTPASMANISNGSTLWINMSSDPHTYAADMEYVTVTATTGSTFTATFANSHSGGATVNGSGFNWTIFGGGTVYTCLDGVTQDCVSYQIDSGLHYPTAPLFDVHLTALTWHEIECHLQRNTTTHKGTIRCWADGRFWLQTGPVPDLGTDDLTQKLQIELGMFTNQGGGNPAHGTQNFVYIDDFIAADGWIPLGS